MDYGFIFHEDHYNKETKIMSGVLEWELNGELKRTKIEYSLANVISGNGGNGLLEGKSVGDAIIASLIDRSNKLNEIQFILQNRSEL